MAYILNPKIALRSWRLVPYAYLMEGKSTASGLTEEEFEVLKRCDGHTQQEETETVASLLKRNLIIPCESGEKQLDTWQKHIVCDNRYLPMLNLQITGKCNYNCRHCFNCADNAPLNTEMSYEQVLKLLDECVACGVTSFTITGGEPFVHPHFMDIMREIYRRRMFVFELNSNGYFINEKVLDELLSFGCKPAIKISFDGLGFHDWMRAHAGAEKRALDAIRLCLAKGFETRVQMNANRKNAQAIYPSLCALDEMGVKDLRLIKTTNAPRWEQNAAGQSFKWDEYYDFLCGVFGKYANEEHGMNVDVWQVLYYNAQGHYYNLAATAYRQLDADSPICTEARSMMAISSEGEVYPCMQMQGYMTEHNISFGNVFRDGLQPVLADSAYFKHVCTPLSYKLDRNEKCAECAYVKYCRGGCPALAVLTHGGDYGCYYSEDRTKCLINLEGYGKKLKAAFGARNQDSCECDGQM